MKRVLCSAVPFLWAITITSAQNVGIGTTTPAHPLTVKSDFGIGISQETADGLTSIGFFTLGNEAYLQTHTNNSLLFATNNNVAQMALLTNGNFGIGTIAPDYVLTVNAAASGIGISQQDQTGTVKVGFFTAPGGAYVQTHSNDDLNFTTGNGPSRMVLKTNGNFGIRNSAPNASLSVGRGTGVDGTAAFFGTTHTSHFNYDVAENTYIRAGKDNGFVIINDIPGSKVGVGTSTPLAALHVKETNPNFADGILLEYTTNIKWITKVDPSGDYQFLRYNSGINGYNILSYINSATGAYTVFSDARLKKNITALSADEMLSKLRRLRPVKYQYSFNGRQVPYSYGFIAQEVENIFPDFVGHKEGKESLSYEAFIPVMVNSIQEQQRQIEELKKEIATLRQLIFSKQ